MLNYHNKYLKYKKKYLEIKKNMKGGSGAVHFGFLTPEELPGGFEDIPALPSQAQIELNRIVAVLTSKDKIPTQISAEFFDNTFGKPDNILAFIKFGAFQFNFSEINITLSEGLRPQDHENYAIESAYRNFLEHCLMRDYTPGKKDKKIIRAEAWKIIAETPYYLKPYKLFCELVDSEDGNTKFVGGQRLNLFLLYMYINKIITDAHYPEHNIIFKAVLELPPSDVDFTTKNFEGQNFDPDKITQWTEEIQQYLYTVQQFELPQPTIIKTYDIVFNNAFNIEIHKVNIEKQLKDIISTKNSVNFFNILREPTNKDWISCYSKKLTDAQIIEDAKSLYGPTFKKIEKFIEDNIAIFLGRPTIANLAEAGDFNRIKNMFLTFLNSKKTSIKMILSLNLSKKDLIKTLKTEIGLPIFTSKEIDYFFAEKQLPHLSEFEKVCKKIFISIYLLHNYKKYITRIATQSISVCQIYSPHGYINKHEYDHARYKYVPLPIQRIKNYKNQNNRWTEEEKRQIYEQKFPIASEIFDIWQTFFSDTFKKYGIEWKTNMHANLYIDGSHFLTKESIGIPGYKFTQSEFYVPEIQIKNIEQTILELLLLKNHSKDCLDNYEEDL